MATMQPHAKSADRTMFEVYLDHAYSGQYRVVYYTELTEANKDAEINRALSGEHYVDGFLKNQSKEEAKRIIDALLDQLNRGHSMSPRAFLEQLAPYLA